MILQKTRKKTFPLDCRQKRRKGFQTAILKKMTNGRETTEFCGVFQWFVVYLVATRFQQFQLCECMFMGGWHWFSMKMKKMKRFGREFRVFIVCLKFWILVLGKTKNVLIWCYFGICVLIMVYFCFHDCILEYVICTRVEVFKSYL